jgi:hypothetical protein
MLRHFVPLWSAVSLAASLLFCAAILLWPLATGDLNLTAPISRIAEPVEPRVKALERVAGIGPAIDRHSVSEDALVLRVSAGAR